MPDAEWISNIRKIVLQAVEAGDPCNILSGEVVTGSPLTIKIEGMPALKGANLILTERVTDHVKQMSVPGIGEVNVTMRGALKSGEKVLLIQKRGAQEYVVIDRW